ncbi:hypothetical protein DDSR119_59 [Pseudomonas phage DDSR119]|nr:hypothetical protein DDSR119_59 [Pseudomonas phage DDSR119]
MARPTVGTKITTIIRLPLGGGVWHEATVIGTVTEVGDYTAKYVIDEITEEVNRPPVSAVKVGGPGGFALHLYGSVVLPI